MSLPNNLGRLSAAITSDASLNLGVGVTPSGTYKFEVGTTSKFTGVATFGSTLSNGTYTYTLPSATGTLALTSAIPTNAVGASGFWTSGFLAKINGTYTVTSSIIQDDGGSHVAIGYLTNPSLYMLDVNGTGRFVGQLTLGSTITNGTYTYTLPSATGTLALTSALSGYLPLTGGTLTGALGGTTASFNTFLGVGTSTQRDPGTRSLAVSGVSSGYAASLDLYSTRSYAIYTNVSGSLGFYDLTAGAERLTIASTGAATFSSPNSVIANNQGIKVYSTDSQAADLGGGISFGGYYVGTSTTADFANIKSGKDNSTSGNYAGYLSFSTNAQATGNVERMRITSGGNVGIGVTPSDWFVVYKALQIGSYGAAISGQTNDEGLKLWNNAYPNASNIDTYSASRPANKFEISAGNFKWFSAPSGTAGNAITFTQTMTLTSGGNVLIGSTTDQGNWKAQVTGNMFIRGSGATSATNGLYMDNSSGTGLLQIRNDGYFQASGIYNFSSSGGTAVYVSADGGVYRFTSSQRYKREINDYTKGLSDLLNIQPKSFKSKNSKEGEKVFAGLIAEQIDEIGLKEFVEYNDKGQPDAVHYSAMTALLVKAIQEQQEQIKELQSQINK